MREFFSKIALVAAFGLALTFTFSCSTDGGTGGRGSDNDKDGDNSWGNGKETKTYAIDIKNSSFTYEKEYISYECQKYGILTQHTYKNEETVDFSINNNVMVWKNAAWKNDIDGELKFNGTSNSLPGTWTRTKSKTESCKKHIDKNDSWYSCQEDYDIVKAFFTTGTVEITRDICDTDNRENGKIKDGWEAKIIDCNTIEWSKGNDKITMKEKNGKDHKEEMFEVTYKGKVCKFSQPSESQRESACKQAWERCSGSSDMYCTESYSDSFADSFYKCMKDYNFPPVVFSLFSSDDGSGEPAAPPADGGEPFTSRTVEVGGTGYIGSFVDLDNITIYSLGTYQSNISEIDIVYGPYYGGGDYIYSTDGAINSELNVDFSYAEKTLIWALTNAQTNIIKNANNYHDIESIANTLNKNNAVDRVEAINGKGFAVQTSNGNMRFGYVSSKNGEVSIEITVVYPN